MDDPERFRHSPAYEDVPVPDATHEGADLASAAKQTGTAPLTSTGPIVGRNALELAPQMSKDHLAVAGDAVVHCGRRVQLRRQLGFPAAGGTRDRPGLLCSRFSIIRAWPSSDTSTGRWAGCCFQLLGGCS